MAVVRKNFVIFVRGILLVLAALRVPLTTSAAARASGRHDLTQLLHFALELGQRDNTGAELFVPEEHPLTEDIHRDHLLRSDRGSQGLPLLGKPLARGHVEIVLVLE